MSSKTYSFTFNITGPEGSSGVYEIPIGVTTIGRDADNVLRLDNRSVSRHHARLDCIVGECEIIDLDSSNGVFINDTRIPAQKPVRINPGDKVRIGPHYEMVLVREEIVEETAEVSEEPQPEGVREQAAPLIQAEEVPAAKKGKKTKTPAPEEAAPPPPPPPPDEPVAEESPNGFVHLVPPGLSTESTRLIHYLPGIYHDNDFLRRFLAIFEAILFPIEWNIDNFDLFLSPKTTPSSFMSWLSGWLGGEFDSTWTEAQRRTFLAEAHALYARRGTKWALERALEIYTGHPAEVDDLSEDLRPHAFRIQLTVSPRNVNLPSLENLIAHYKPAHTDYELIFKV